MQVVFLTASVLHAVFAIVLVSLSVSPELTLTFRRQFDEWPGLLDAFRKAGPGPDATLKPRALSLSWCNVTLPPETTRAPYCACVAKTADKFANASAQEGQLQPARDAAVMDLVACLRDRPVWRVWPVWAVRLSTPAVYALYVAACFLWVAADLPSRYQAFPLWVLSAVLVVALMVRDYVHNSFWAFTFLLVVLLIDWILVPGMARGMDWAPVPSADTGEPASRQGGGLTRTPSCFWWCEYLTAPVFALYVPLMHCGRDLYFTAVFTMIGTAVGGLGLRSFWCAQAYSEGFRTQFRGIMQDVVWLGILASCVALSFLTGIYFSADAPYTLGAGSVGLLVLTFAVSLLQWPGNQDYRQLLMTQMCLALARNVALFGIVAADVLR